MEWTYSNGYKFCGYNVILLALLFPKRYYKLRLNQNALCYEVSKEICKVTKKKKTSENLCSLSKKNVLLIPTKQNKNPRFITFGDMNLTKKNLQNFITQRVLVQS